jgi:hypothetical protein
MFISNNGILTKRIYDGNGKYIVGFNFNEYEFDYIIKILNHAKKY